MKPHNKRFRSTKSGAHYKRLLDWRSRALRRLAATEKSLNRFDKEITYLERRFKDQTDQWKQEAQASKAARGAALRRRKKELADIVAYGKLIAGHIEYSGVHPLYIRAGAHVGYHLGVTKRIMYLFGKGWFQDVSLIKDGRGWRGTPVPFGRPNNPTTVKDAAE